MVEDPDRTTDEAAPAASAETPMAEATPAPPVSEPAATESASVAETVDQPAAGEMVQDVAPVPMDAVAVEEEEVFEDEPEDDGPPVHVEPLEFIDESVADSDLTFDWYILKVAVNREDSIKEALLRRVRMNGLEKYFREIVVPTEDVKEFTKTGKSRVVKKKLYPGYILVNMSVTDESWFIVRETPGIGDFTGAGGKPTPMLQKDVDRILKLSRPVEEGPGGPVKTTIPFKKGDRVRVKEGYFQNFEGDVDAVDEANGRVTVLVSIFGRSTPVELQHWQVEAV